MIVIHIRKYACLSSTTPSFYAAPSQIDDSKFINAALANVCHQVERGIATHEGAPALLMSRLLYYDKNEQGRANYREAPGVDVEMMEDENSDDGFAIRGDGGAGSVSSNVLSPDGGDRASASSGSNGEGGGDGGAGVAIGKAEKALRSVAAGGERDKKRDRANLRGLSAACPSTVIAASKNLLRASDGSEKKIKAILGVMRIFLREESKKSDANRTSPHIVAFVEDQSLATCMVTICSSKPSLSPLFQSFGDKMKDEGVLPADFIDDTFKIPFTTILQEEDNRLAELRRLEEIQRQKRAEAEHQATMARAKRREDERQRAEAERRAQLQRDQAEAEAKRKEEESNRALLTRLTTKPDRGGKSVKGAHLSSRKAPERQTKAAANKEIEETKSQKPGLPESKSTDRVSVSPSPSGAVPLAAASNAVVNSPSKATKASSLPKRGRASNTASSSTKPSQPQRKKRKSTKKKRKRDEKNSFEQELKAEGAYLNEDNGERSERAGLGRIPPVQHPNSVTTDEPDLSVPEAHRQYVDEAKAKFIDAIIAFILKHADYLNDKGRGKSIYLGNNLFLTLNLLDIDTLRSLAHLIDIGLSSKTIEKKLEEAMKSCKFYYDTKTEQFCKPNGEVICKIDDKEQVLELLSRAGAYYVFALDEEPDEIYEHSGGKFMTPPRVFDYTNITPSKIKRLLHENGTPPARIIFCCMAQLPFSGRLDLENDEVPNTRNRIVEVVESVYLMVLKLTIPGFQLYGDGRTMSGREFVEWLKQRGAGQGLGFFHNGVGRKKSSSSGENSASGGGLGKGTPGMARAARNTGAGSNFKDPLDLEKLANFHFFYAKGRGHNREIFECSKGHLFWNNGYLKTTLNGDDAIEFNGEERKKNQAAPLVAIDMPIKLIPSDNSGPVELGTVQGGEFEKFYPKPSTCVCMSGIPREFDDSIVGDMLKVALEDDEDESIVQVQRRDDGSVRVQFSKVWEARGCEILLDGDEKLFGEKIAVKLWYG